MTKIKQFILLFLLSTLYCTTHVYAQECSVSLSGTYQLDPESGEGLYDTFVFDGGGKVGIHTFTESKADFFQIGDTVIIYPDKSIFVFLRKDDQTLVGTSMWVKDKVYKRMENDTVITPMQIRDQKYADQFYEYYTLTGRDAPSLSTYMSIIMDSTMNASMKKLCDEDFPRACLTMANALMLTSPGLMSYLQGAPDDDHKLPPNKEIYDYFVKAIELGELDGIAQLGAYIFMLGHKDQAIKVFEKGCELGHAGCCISLATLQIEWDEEE